MSAIESFEISFDVTSVTVEARREARRASSLKRLQLAAGRSGITGVEARAALARVHAANVARHDFVDDKSIAAGNDW